MNTVSYPMFALVRWLALGCLLLSALISLHAAETGRISGQVRNAGTGQYLVDAEVVLVGSGRSVLTARDGTFSLSGVPAGSHSLLVTYTGLDAQTVTATVGEGGDAKVDIALTADVYQLDAFVVDGVREGNAASIVRQRNAPNVKSVVALDAVGNLSNDNPGELLARLSGVSPNITDEGDVFSVYIRGIDPTLNSVNIDGNKMATSAAMSREYRFLNVSAGAFEELEVVKAPTPDMDPDSLGGAVNMKTKSSLSMRERRRISYRIGAKWAPPFMWDQTPTREEHRIHPITSFGYQEVFDLFGKERNLGVSLNLFYVENPTTYASTLRDYTFALTDPAYVWEYRTNDAYNLRKQRSANLKVDYQAGPRTRLSLGFTFADAFESQKVNYQTRASTARSIATVVNGQPTGTGAIMPGYTDDFTEVRPVNNSIFETTTSANAFMDRTRRLQFDLTDQRDRLETDVSLSYSQSSVHLNSGQAGGPGKGGAFVTSIRAVGWTLDASESREYPEFVQTAGPSILEMSNYRSGQLSQLNGTRDGKVYVGSVNLKYDLGVDRLHSIKAGVRLRRQESAERNGSQRFVYVGPDGVAGTTDDDLTRFQIPGLQRTSDYGLGAIPFVHTPSVRDDLEANPQNWSEDVYYRESQRLSGTRKVTEDVSAAYLMGTARFGSLRLLAGLRAERTDVEGEGWAQNATLPTITDPVLRAATEYGAKKRIKGSYDHLFPGVHFAYAFRKGLVARASWSTSIGRPAFSNLIPREDPDVTDQTITVNNPSLKAQYGDSFDLSLEYYFEPVGAFTVGAFQKDLSDFIFTDSGGVVGAGPDNGFDGQYAGYGLITQSNGGDARIRGLEISYQQELTFLPSALRGLGVLANYTYLTTQGNYGEGVERSSNQVARFVPRGGNVGLNFKRDRFSARILVNYVGEHLYSYSTNDARLRYKMARTLTNLNLSYQLRKGLTLYCDLSNVFQAPQRYYIGLDKKERLQSYIDNGPSLNFGVSGSF